MPGAIEHFIGVTALGFDEEILCGVRVCFEDGADLVDQVVSRLLQVGESVALHQDLYDKFVVVSPSTRIKDFGAWILAAVDRDYQFGSCFVCTPFFDVDM